MDKIYYSSIASNKIANLPFWKENRSLNSYFIKNGEEWSYIDKNEDKFSLTKLTKLNNFHKFLYFGNDIFVISLMSLLIFLSYSSLTMQVIRPLLFFGLLIVASYILMFSFKRPKSAGILLFFACIATAIFILKSYGVLALYNNLVILCAIYVIFAFMLPSLITKKLVINDLRNGDNAKVNFFTINTIKGILLVVYRSEKLNEEEIKNLLEKQERAKNAQQQNIKHKSKKYKKITKNEEIQDEDYYDEE